MKNLLLAVFSFALLITGLIVSPIKEYLPGFWWVMGFAFVLLLFNFKKGWKYLIGK